MTAHTEISDDDHSHEEPRLGPLDWGAWAYALVGVGARAIVVLVFWVAID